MSGGELVHATALELGARLAAKAVSAVELAQAFVRRIEAVDSKVHAFLNFDPSEALAQARASDERRAKNSSRGPLDGVPIALKDNILVRGQRTTAASRMLENFVSPYDATVTSRLEQAGLVRLGKTNMDEFAMGSSTENSAFGPTRNPFDLTRTPGGSSGGSAAALAASMAPLALGTDTGGSIRQPAAMTGTVGFKPSYGRVSRYGVVAFASSLDQVGPMARSVDDAVALFEVLAGHDPFDATSAPEAAFSASSVRGEVTGLRVGLPKEYFSAGLDPEVRAATERAAKTLEALGAVVTEISLPHTASALPAYYVIAPAEASSNLSRYDGVRFGHRASDPKGLGDLYARSRGEGFGPEVKRRIMLGTFALSAGYYDAYSLTAQKVRTLVRRDFDAAFETVDVIASATSPIPAFPLGAKANDPLSMYLVDALTIPCNLAGLPGISVPCGATASALPIGLQLLAKRFADATVLGAARAFEQATASAAVPRPAL